MGLGGPSSKCSQSSHSSTTSKAQICFPLDLTALAAHGRVAFMNRTALSTSLTMPFVCGGTGHVPSWKAPLVTVLCRPGEDTVTGAWREADGIGTGCAEGMRGRGGLETAAMSKCASPQNRKVSNT